MTRNHEFARKCIQHSSQGRPAHGGDEGVELKKVGHNFHIGTIGQASMRRRATTMSRLKSVACWQSRRLVLTAAQKHSSDATSRGHQPSYRGAGDSRYLSTKVGPRLSRAELCVKMIMQVECIRLVDRNGMATAAQNVWGLAVRCKESQELSSRLGSRLFARHTPRISDSDGNVQAAN